LFEYLSSHPDLNEHGRLFVIVGRGTFSSGLWAAYDMKKTNAVFVGEPTGGKPNHLGEVKSVQLPSSGLTLYYSTRDWVFLQDEDPAALEPEVRVEFLSSDYFAGKDAALEAVFEFVE
ncbi:MAG: peptidase S41, partial [Planctomycetota bacterium]